MLKPTHRLCSHQSGMEVLRRSTSGKASTEDSQPRALRNTLLSPFFSFLTTLTGWFMNQDVSCVTLYANTNLSFSEPTCSLENGDDGKAHFLNLWMDTVAFDQPKDLTQLISLSLPGKHLIKAANSSWRNCQSDFVLIFNRS